jgi:hypothetical protein
LSGLDSIDVITNGSGIAEATLTTGIIADSNIVTALRVDNRADSVQFGIGTVSGGVSYYSLSPSTGQTIVAGDSVAYTLYAHDQYGNRVATSDSVTLEAVGSITAGFSPEPYEFGGADSLLFSVSDTTAGLFTVRADNIDLPAVTGSSGLITILPGDVTSIIRLSSADSINVGGERLLQYALEDTYGNRLSDSLVTFTRFNGNGLFSNGSSTLDTLTNAGGVAEALYTASDTLSFGTDRIEITYGPINDTLDLPLRSSLVSYYTLSPTGPQSITAGDSLEYVITARDQFGNAIANSDSIIASAVGSSTAGFSPGNYDFNGADTVVFKVSDASAGAFTVRVENSGNSAVNGQSGLVTVSVAGADSLIKVSGDGSGIIAGTDRLLRVLITDSFNNPVSGDSVRFIVHSGGGNLGGLDSVGVASDSQGEAAVNFTTGDSVGTNIVTALRVTDRGDSVQFSIATAPAGISYYTVIPDTNIFRVDTTINVTVTAYDVYDNVVTTDSSTVVEFLTTGTRVNFNPPEDTLNAGTLTFSLSDSAAETMTVTARSKFDITKTGTSPVLNVLPGAADSLFKISGDASGIIAGANQLLRARVTDAFLNEVQGSTVRFIVRNGGGNFGGSDSVDVVSVIAGLAETVFTTGVLADSNIVTALLVDNRADSIQFGIGTISGRWRPVIVLPTHWQHLTSLAMRLPIMIV